MANVFTMDAPEEIGGAGNFMTEPGAFHFLVTDIRAGEDRRGEILNGFSVELQARTGNEIGKTLNLKLRNGELTHKDGGEMCRKKQAAFLIAANVITPDQLGQKGVQVDLDKAKHQQICAELELGDPSESTGKRYLDVRFTNFYHVDDPRAKSIPKAADELALIPADRRRKPEFFEKLSGHHAAKPAVTDDDLTDL